jgi:uncharacterized repeat protein (TIGR03803 family)
MFCSVSSKCAIFRVAFLWAALGVVAHAQTFTVLYNFAGGATGQAPFAGLTMDQGGNLYGTTSKGGTAPGGCGGCGTVFKLSRSRNGGWTLNPLYSFQGSGSGDGSTPLAGVVFGPDSALYGTTSTGGPMNGPCRSGCGVVFRLAPQPTACHTALCPWDETVIYSFQGGAHDGANPNYGNVVFDQAGNLDGVTLYGTGYLCNDSTCGAFYQLSHSSSGWAESAVLGFGGDLGYWPYAGVTLDSAGNLYGGTTWNFSSIYQLTPTESSFVVTPLYAFSNYSQDGTNVEGNVVLDQAGNLYGTTASDGPNGGGTVFELSPSGGSWTLTTLYSFTGSGSQVGPTSLLMDAAGNLYGTTANLGQNGLGNVFKLTRSGNSWTYTSLHDFSGLPDGSTPYGNLAMDAVGNLYGTTSQGGSGCDIGCGVVWEVTP